jgi:DinB superfamily
MMIPKPDASEYAPFYAGYVGKVPDTGPMPLLESQLGAFEALGRSAIRKADYRYAEGKWSVKEVLGHLSDAERVFSYRLLRFARNDRAPLAGWDENQWAAAAPHAGRPLDHIVQELLAVRRGTLALVRSLDEAALARKGVANNAEVTVRALCWITPGHAQHHLDVLRERYAVA